MALELVAHSILPPSNAEGPAPKEPRKEARPTDRRGEGKAGKGRDRDRCADPPPLREAAGRDEGGGGGFVGRQRDGEAGGGAGGSASLTLHVPLITVCKDWPQKDPGI